MQRFNLPAQLDIRQVGEVREALLQASPDGHVLLDASAVESVDTAGIQLLASALLAEPRRATGLIGVTDSLREALVALGMADALLVDARPVAH